MAVQNSVALTTNSGLQLPAGNVIISQVGFPIPTRKFDENGVFIGVTRVIQYSLQFYPSIASVQTEDDSPINDGVRLLPNGWARIMTEKEFTALQTNGYLAEVWLKDWVQSIIGGNSTVVNPYA